MELSQISALLAPFLDRPLPTTALAHISTYIDLLLRWNSRINLTAIRDPDSIVTRHFGESFFLARHLFPAPINDERPISSSSLPASIRRVPRAARTNSQLVARSSQLAIDIGSGAGFPGLPLRLWAPHISLSLIESNHKKAAFLREVSRALTLTDVNVITERAESLIGRVPPADLVTFRAVERFDNIAPLATRFLAPQGRVAALIGASQFSALTTLPPGLHWAPPIAIPHSQARVLVISSI